MKSNLNIKSIIIIAIIGVFSLVFFNKSFAAITGTVNVETANIRQTTQSDSTILEQASKGESVQIIEKSENWYKVKYNGVEGYIREDLLDVNQDVDVTSNTASTEGTTETKTPENNDTEKTENESSNKNETQQSSQNGEQPKTEETVPTATETQKNENSMEGMYATIDNTKLKLIPLVNGNDIKEIAKDTTINVLEVYNNWALAESGIDRGWVLYSKIKKVDDTVTQDKQQNDKDEDEKVDENKPEDDTKTAEETSAQNKENNVVEKTMYINWDAVNLREKPTTSSQTITSLTKGTEVTVIAEENEWSKVKVNNMEGYIKSSLLSENRPQVTTSRSLEQERQPVQTPVQENTVTTPAQTPTAEQNVATQDTTNSGIGEQVCNYARQFLGCKYVYGGTTPNGFDCSGFTQYVFKHFGVTLNRTAEAQASNGTYVAKSNLKAGDLLIFTSHAGIYLGDGTFIHAANSRTGVIITSLSDSYYVRNYITARRIF